jgi:hypothetical protein
MRALYVHVYAVIRDCTCLFVGVWVYVCGCVYVCRCVSVSNNAFLSLSLNVCTSAARAAATWPARIIISSTRRRAGDVAAVASIPTLTVPVPASTASRG